MFQIQIFLSFYNTVYEVLDTTRVITIATIFYHLMVRNVENSNRGHKNIDK